LIHESGHSRARFSRGVGLVKIRPTTCEPCFSKIEIHERVIAVLCVSHWERSQPAWRVWCAPPPGSPTVSSPAHAPGQSCECRRGQRRSAGQTSCEKTSRLGTELWLQQRSIEVPPVALGLRRETRDSSEPWQVLRPSALLGHYRKLPRPRPRHREQSTEVSGAPPRPTEFASAKSRHLPCEDP